MMRDNIVLICRSIGMVVQIVRPATVCGFSPTMRNDVSVNMATQAERLAGLGSTWAEVTAVDIYTPHPIRGFLERELLAVMLREPSIRSPSNSIGLRTSTITGAEPCSRRACSSAGAIVGALASPRLWRRMADMGPAHLENVADLACRTALAYRGVAHITFPVDIQEMELPGERSKRNVAGHTSDVADRSGHCPVEGALRRAADVLNAGRKVAILAGRGAIGAADELEAAADRLAAPIIKALLGKSAVPDDSPFTTGPIGLLGSRPSQEAMEECDTLLIVGSSFPYIEFMAEATSAAGWGSVAAGVAGVASAGLLGWIIFCGGRRLSLGRFFTVTTVLLIFLAAGLFSTGIGRLQSLGVLPMMTPLWDTSWLLSDSSVVGSFLAGLLGYRERPSPLQAAAHVAYLLVVGFVILGGAWRRPHSASAVRAGVSR